MIQRQYTCAKTILLPMLARLIFSSSSVFTSFRAVAVADGGAA
jgi:hypothetical protein